MKLFAKFEAVKFHQENLIFITNNKYLYYIYNFDSKVWSKHRNAGNDSIAVENYEDVSREELTEAMNGVFPQKETDFMRLCNPTQLCIRDMFDLLREDYPKYISDDPVAATIHTLLLASEICFKSFLRIKEILDSATEQCQDVGQVLIQIEELYITITGRDIYKKEIGIVDGHDSSSYFWIMPVRIIDYSDTNASDSVAEMRSIEISIEEDDVYRYLSPFLYKHYDDELEANKNRVEYCFTDDDGNEQTSFLSGFEWYLTYNFYTFDSVTAILKDIKDTIDTLLSRTENEFTAKLKSTEIDLVVDFYQRFIYRMEYMMRVGSENGYDLISFMGP